jgi:YhcH/YjgK/YiaL family protein
MEGDKMIYGNIKYRIKDYKEQIKKCLAYAEREKLIEKEPGNYEIENDDVYVNVISYETAPMESKEWEAHRKYIDLHYVLVGRERMDLNFIDNMEQKPYHCENDFLVLSGDKRVSVVIGSGEYVVCFPEDAHMPGIQVEQPEVVKKAIFKIRVKE